MFLTQPEKPGGRAYLKRHALEPVIREVHFVPPSWERHPKSSVIECMIQDTGGEICYFLSVRFSKSQSITRPDSTSSLS
jgi:hypothetical protein